MISSHSHVPDGRRRLQFDDGTYPYGERQRTMDTPASLGRHVLDSYSTSPTAPAATASAATTIYFQTLYDWTLDTPGNYSLSVVLTLIAP